VKAKKVGSGVEYLRDGTAVENHAVWEFPIDADALASGTVKGTGEAASDKVVLRKSTRTYSLVNGIATYTYSAMADASADYAAVNTLVDAGAFMQLPVHRGILFGMEALVKINVEGLSDSPQIIVKALGSSGVADPINQRQSIGYKVDGFGLAIKRPEAICITYGIPKFAELAALTNRVISGNWELMDGLKDDDSVVNKINATDGAGVLRVDTVNDPRYAAVPSEPIVMGTGVFPIFSASVNYAIGDKVLYNNVPYIFTATHTAASWNVDHVVKASQFNTLEENPLDNGGNDEDSNVK
jgi:hypothetical protein